MKKKKKEDIYKFTNLQMIISLWADQTWIFPGKKKKKKRIIYIYMPQGLAQAVNILCKWSWDGPRTSRYPSTLVERSQDDPASPPKAHDSHYEGYSENENKSIKILPFLIYSTYQVPHVITLKYKVYKFETEEQNNGRSQEDHFYC